MGFRWRKLHPVSARAFVNLPTYRPREKVANIRQLDDDYALMERILMEKILIVEHDEAVQRALKRLFESAGYAMEVSREGHPIALTAQEFKIVKFFLHNEERDVSRDELLKEALGYHDYPSLRTVDNHILKLRQKLERDPENPTHFLTAHRVGYRF